MATAFDRFIQKMACVDDCLFRMGYKQLSDAADVQDKQDYLESQLSRLKMNAERALRYLEEIGCPGSMETELEQQLDQALNAIPYRDYPEPPPEKIARG